MIRQIPIQQRSRCSTPVLNTRSRPPPASNPKCFRQQFKSCSYRQNQNSPAVQKQRQRCCELKERLKLSIIWTGNLSSCCSVSAYLCRYFNVCCRLNTVAPRLKSMGSLTVLMLRAYQAPTAGALLFVLPFLTFDASHQHTHTYSLAFLPASGNTNFSNNRPAFKVRLYSYTLSASTQCMGLQYPKQAHLSQGVYNQIDSQFTTTQDRCPTVTIKNQGFAANLLNPAVSGHG